MQNTGKSRCLIFILVAAILLTLFSGCSDKDEKEYHKLINSYTQDRDYKKGTDAIKKSVRSANSENPLKVSGSSGFSKSIASIVNSGKLKGVPILIYHCIDTTIWGDKPMFVSQDNFNKQMKYLKDQGYTAITFNDFNRLDSISKPILITFDDGYEDNFTNAYPILKKYGFKATIFLIVDMINRPKFLKLQEINEMRDVVDFQCHTMTHPHLANLAQAKITYQLSESKIRLESMLHKKINVLAYPYGSYNKEVISIAKKYYTYGVTTNFGRFVDTPQNEYTVKRMYVINQMDLNKFIKLFG